MKNAVARTTARHGAGMLEVQLPLATLQRGSAGILGAWRAALEATLRPEGGSRVKLAIIDHIASFPPVHMPVQEMAAACKALGVAGEAFDLGFLRLSARCCCCCCCWANCSSRHAGAW